MQLRLLAGLFICGGLVSSAQAQTVWTSLLSGFWNDPLNWSSGVPLISGSALISSSSLTITVGSTASTSYSVSSLTCNSVLRVVNNNELNVFSPLVATNRVEIDRGVLRLSTGFAGIAPDVELSNSGTLRFGSNTNSSVSHSGRVFAAASVGSVDSLGSLTLSSTSVLTGNFFRVAAYNLTNFGLIQQTAGTLRVENIRNFGSVITDASGTISMVENQGTVSLTGAGKSVTVSGQYTGAQLGGQFSADAGSVIFFSGTLTLTGDYNFDALGSNCYIGGTVRGGNILNSAAQPFSGVTFRDNTTFDSGLNLDTAGATFRYVPTFGSNLVTVRNGAELSIIASGGSLTAGRIELRSGARLSGSSFILNSDVDAVDSQVSLGSGSAIESGKTIDLRRSTLAMGSNSVNRGTIRFFEGASSVPTIQNNGLIEVLSGARMTTNLISNAGNIHVSGSGSSLVFRKLLPLGFMSHVQVDTNGHVDYSGGLDLQGSTFDHRDHGQLISYGGFQNGSLVASGSLSFVPNLDGFQMKNVLLDEGFTIANPASMTLGSIQSAGDIVVNGCNHLSIEQVNPTLISAPHITLRSIFTAYVPISTLTLDANVDLIDSNWDLPGQLTTVTASKAFHLENSTWGLAGASESRVVQMDGELTGTGTVVADLLVSGGIGPGANSAPGQLNISGGKLTLQSGSLTEFDLFSAQDYDRITTSGQVTSLGGTLRVRQNSGYAASGNPRFDLILAANGYSGTFSSLDIPDGWQVEYSANRVSVLAPEPSSMTAVGLGGVALVLRSRRRSGARYAGRTNRCS